MSNTRDNRPGLIDNLSGSLDIMLGRENGMTKIDHSTTGFWLSFWGVILMLLIDTSGLSMIYNVSVDAAKENAYSKSTYIFFRVCIAFLGYVASFLALYLLCRTSDEQSRFPDAVIVNNWAQQIQCEERSLIAQQRNTKTKENIGGLRIGSFFSRI